MANRCPEGELVDEIYVCATLIAVLAARFVTDSIRIHASLMQLLLEFLSQNCFYFMRCEL